MTRLLPPPLRRWLRGETGTRFARFVVVAAAAFAATQLTLFGLVLAHVSAGLSGFLGAVAGAAVSYVLSRWAWERKGRPSVLTETLPFWLVSLSAWAALSLAAHYGAVWAHSLGAAGLARAAIINGVTAAANLLTFAARFLIFHFILFADRGTGSAGSAGSAGRRGRAQGLRDRAGDRPGEAAVTAGPGSAGSPRPAPGAPPGSAPR